MFRHHYPIAEEVGICCSNCGATQDSTDLFDVSESWLSSFLPINSSGILCYECLKSLESQAY